ncbi:hypothetical protein ACWFRJ_35425 [Streptomyces sp. NPDC055239]
MPNSADALGVIDSFERCERLCRTAREVIEKARRTRSEAVEIRLKSKQIRADRQRRLASRRREDGASGPALPIALPLGGPAPVPAPLQLTALAAFVHARLDEEAASADLFHDVGCPAAEAPGNRGSPAGCRCRTPRRIHQKTADRRSIAHISEATVREADHAAPDWPRNEMDALLDLRTLAVEYELHWLWQEEWRP